MLDISDIQDFTQASYNPLISFLFSLLCVSSLLNVRQLARLAIESVMSGLGQSVSEEQGYARLVIGLIFFFAWFPLFQNMSSLAPFEVWADPASAMYYNNTEKFQKIGCVFFPGSQDIRLIGNHVFYDLSNLQGDGINKAQNAFFQSLSTWYFGQSMFVLLVFVSVVFVFSPDLRKLAFFRLVASALAVLYFLLVGYSQSKEAIDVYSVERLKAYEHQGISIEGTQLTDCIKKQFDDWPPRTEHLAPSVTLEFRWPDLTGFVPR